jgi:hypothetical protein
MWCTDTCAFANNSACQDGGSGSLTARFGAAAQCAIGTAFAFPATILVANAAIFATTAAT